VLSQVIPDPNQREAFLLALANRFEGTPAVHLGELAGVYWHAS
jgi:hypothetical protein